MKVVHKESGKELAKNIQVADSFYSRLIGLMFRKEMRDLDGLLIRNSNSVHNCFVRFSLDLVFVTNDMKIVKIIKNFKPWRFTRIYFKARHVLELPAGAAIEEMKEGDQLEVLGV